MKFIPSRFSLDWADAPLTTRFAVYSFICIGIMTGALWFLVSGYLVNGILRREWETTAQFVRMEVREYLTVEDFTTKDRKSVGHKFEALLRHISLMPDIARFKVYNPQGVVIWSDDKRLVGRSFADNEQLQKAIRGEVVADISALGKQENIFDKGLLARAVEVYVPIYIDNPRRVLGVMEIYKNPQVIYRDLKEARLVVLIGALGGGLLLYLSLFAIVRQAARKISEQQDHLLTIQSELVASQRMAAIGEIAAAVAHGIGNPLSSIRAAAQVAKLGYADNGEGSSAGAEAALQSIIEQVDRVQKRMRGLLNFARPMEPHPSPVEVNTAVAEILTVLGSRFEEAGVDPQLDLDINLPKIRADANQLEQILMGLITNALEATPRGGRVKIITKANGENARPADVRITVEDTGEGIPAGLREKVFEPFFTTKSHGTGIGLPLVRKFVERNGGKIAVADAPNGGAKFEVVFPRFVI